MRDCMLSMVNFENPDQIIVLMLLNSGEY